jgi:hypothetical protein
MKANVFKTTDGEMYFKLIAEDNDDKFMLTELNGQCKDRGECGLQKFGGSIEYKNGFSLHSELNFIARLPDKPADKRNWFQRLFKGKQ